MTRDEVAALLREARKERQSRLHLPLFILIALYTGARRRAILDLKWHQCDLVHGTIDFNPPGRPQTSKRRPHIPIPRQLLHFLRQAQRRATCDHVVSRDGKPIVSVKKSFGTATRKAGLEDVTTHTLRHTCGCWMAQSGVDLWQIGGWLGHSQQKTTELYLHHHPSFLGQAKEALEGRTAGIVGIQRKSTNTGGT